MRKKTGYYYNNLTGNKLLILYVDFSHPFYPFSITFSLYNPMLPTNITLINVFNDLEFSLLYLNYFLNNCCFHLRKHQFYYLKLERKLLIASFIKRITSFKEKKITVKSRCFLKRKAIKPKCSRFYL